MDINLNWILTTRYKNNKKMKNTSKILMIGKGLEEVHTI